MCVQVHACVQVYICVYALCSQRPTLDFETWGSLNKLFDGQVPGTHFSLLPWCWHEQPLLLPF